MNQFNTLTVLEEHFKSQINFHKHNIKVMLNNPITIPEHTNYLQSIEEQMEKIAGYEDKLSVLKQHF
jgi:hypothetical protein